MLRATATSFISRLLLMIGIGAVLSASQAHAQQTIIFDSSTPEEQRVIGPSTTTHNGKHVIVRGVTVTIDGTHPFASLTLETGGVVTHTAGYVAGMNLTISGNVTVNNGCSIDVSGRGYAATTGPGAGQSGIGDRRGAGGSHAGRGGYGWPYETSSGPTYGSVTQPTTPGSGGGNGFSNGYAGGAGGGVIRLIVNGTLTINGAINSNGNYASRAGAGAGGSVWITAATLAGAGSINAVGNYADDSGGGGSGGRVAVYYDTNNFTGGYQVYGGRHGWSYGNNGRNTYYAGAGTVYLKKNSDATGDLMVLGQTYSGGYAADTTELPSLPALRNLTLDRWLVVRPAGGSPTFGLSTVQNLTLTDNTWVFGNLNLTAGTINLSGNSYLAGNMNLSVGDLMIAGGSYVHASGYGYPAGMGPGAGESGVGDRRGAGGSHAGRGGRGWPGETFSGPTYDSFTQPTEPGSGGGNGFSGVNIGGAGGGVLRIIVSGTLTVNGVLESNGSYANRAGAGAGGSVWITAATLTGSGSINAVGSQADDNGGGGGGGRVAVYYDTNNFTGGYQVYGGRHGWSYGNNGRNTYYAGAGTVYLKKNSDALGDLTIMGQTYSGGYGAEPTPIDNLNGVRDLTLDRWITVTPANNDSAFIPATLRNLNLSDNAWTFGDLAWAANTITMTGGSRLNGNLNLTTIGDLNLGGGCYLLADGYGYKGSKGPGAGTNAPDGSDHRGGGGGHGGVGGRAYNGIAGGITYDNEKTPTEPGSGGGSAYNGTQQGAAGGGVIRLQIGGKLAMDGNIQANGNRSSNSGGGGAGGSIWITTLEFAGSGYVQADGGYGDNAGGGGGGGRVALYYTTKANFTGSLLANGGPGWEYGGTGTLYQEVFASPYRLSDFTLTPGTVAGSQAATGTVRILNPAPTGGILCYLTSGDPQIATVPETVTIPVGATSVSFPITSLARNDTRTVQIRARQAGDTKTVNLTVKPWLASLKINPPSANSGATLTGTITLNVAAPGAGLAVTVSSSDPLVTFPNGTTVTVPSGTTTQTFNLKVGTVSTAATAIITATAQSQVTASIGLNPANVQAKSVSVAPSAVVGGFSSSGVVTLTKAAPAGGAVVALSSSDTTAQVPAFVTVPFGKTSASFPVTTSTVVAPKSVVISATLGVTKQTTLTVRLPGVLSLALIPSSVGGGETALGVVTLDTTSNIPVTVTITSNDSHAIPQASISIPPGETNGTFIIDTTAVTSTTTAMITAKANGISKTQALTITVAANNNGPVNVGGTVTLNSIDSNAQNQEITFEFRPTNGGSIFQKTAQVPPSGAFSLTGVARGNYNLWVKGAKWLAKVVSLNTSNGDVSDVTVTLRPGDVNNDNSCDIFDLGSLAEAFNTSPGDAKWDPGADLNCDLSADIFDLAILAENFNQSGDP